MTEVVAGIDIGGTNTVIGLADRNGKIIKRTSIPTHSSDSPRMFVSVVADILKSMTAENQCVLRGIGIGAPNGNFYKGTIEFAPNLKWDGIVPMVSFFKEHFELPVVLTNDANAAAMGEMIYGAARGMSDFIEITLGTGLGSGIVCGGKMVFGHYGFAGEIGHTIIIPGGRSCGCGRKGCLETYGSSTGLRRTYAEFSGTAFSPEKSPESLEISTLAQHGDAIAIRAFEFTGEMLGLGLANSVAYTEPEAIFLFGGLTGAGKLLFDPLSKSFEGNLLHVYKGKIRLEPSGLPGNDAAILGAASLILNQG